jgi:hypothetical protein
MRRDIAIGMSEQCFATRQAMAFRTTTRSVLVLATDSGEEHVFSSRMATSQSYLSWQIFCSRQPMFTA